MDLEYSLVASYGQF